MADVLASFSEQIASVVEKAGQSVVGVHARARFHSSGVHWGEGIVVTADHTIQREEEIRIITANGTELSAELVGRDPGTDLAVLRVSGLDTAAERADGVKLKIGQLTLAVGRFKDSLSVGTGVISSISGASPTWRGGHLDKVIRLDIELHPGASGAAVVDISGKVIGIATSALSRIFAFAIPTSTVERVVKTLVAHGRIPRGYLGAGLQPITIPEHLKSKLNLASPSALIAVSVEPDAPAGKAGMLIGDVLLEIGGKRVHRPEDVRSLLDSDSVGKSLVARVIRGGEPVELSITIGERPRRA